MITLDPKTIVLGFAVLLAGLVLYYIEDTTEGEMILSEITERRGRIAEK